MPTSSHITNDDKPDCLPLFKRLRRSISKVEPNILKILPTIPSNISQKNYQFFLFHSYIITYYSYIYYAFVLMFQVHTDI